MCLAGDSALENRANRISAEEFYMLVLSRKEAETLLDPHTNGFTVGDIW
jgi:hypothetical protein